MTSRQRPGSCKTPKMIKGVAIRLAIKARRAIFLSVQLLTVTVPSARCLSSSRLFPQSAPTQWYGLPPLLYGIVMCQIGNWSCPIHEQGGVRHEGYNEWNRCGKERVPGSRRGRTRQCRTAPAGSPLAATAVLQQAGALPDWHGSLRQQPLLGA